MVRVNNRDPVEWFEGMTVTDVLNAMHYDYALITVTVNGELIDEEDWETTRIPDGAEVGLFHLAHGG